MLYIKINYYGKNLINDIKLKLRYQFSKTIFKLTINHQERNIFIK